MGLVISAGDDRVEVDLTGGRITSLVAGGAERLLTAPPRPQDPAAHLQWGCFVMAPFAGRVANGVLAVDGQEVQLGSRLEGHAIHGLVLDRPWRLESHDDTELVVACDFAGPAPVAGHVLHRLHLAPGRLDLELVLTAADGPLPTWVGWHPCFRRTPGDVAVTLPAHRVLTTDGVPLPTGGERQVEGDTDLREGPVIGDRLLDHAYVDVDGPATIRWPDLALSMTFDDPVSTAVVYSQPGICCIEPQTAWPDAARMAAAGHETGLVTLAQGEVLRATTTWTWAAPTTR